MRDFCLVVDVALFCFSWDVFCALQATVSSNAASEMNSFIDFMIESSGLLI